MAQVISHRLPKFKTLWSNYLRGTAKDVKKRIGGKVNYEWIKNTCVIRRSRAFNLGMPICNLYMPQALKWCGQHE